MKKFAFLFLTACISFTFSTAQDSATYKLKLNAPLLDLPQNTFLPNHYPSMNQSVEWSRDFYELAFWGIDALGNKIFIPKNGTYTPVRKVTNFAFKYALGLGFSKYGSELPIPLGVWAHEEFHRTVLGVKNVSSQNGNWFLSRWDGTVYGITDQTLDNLKQTDLNQLLYSYTAGVQYEVLLNQKITTDDFFTKRSHYKNALLLYNAYYVYNYFKFSTSPFSDSVKILAPPHENANPAERDYAGADLTAWAYDMFNPALPFSSRDSFPNGDGVNRRVGFADLSTEAQNYLVKQKKLTLLNFVNPAIFFVNRIKINSDFSFNLFAQYAPTHFGNDVAAYLPVKYKKFNVLFQAHQFQNHDTKGMGIGIGIYNYPVTGKLKLDAAVNYWNQPESFWNQQKINGGSADLKATYRLGKNTAVFAGVSGKTRGWLMGNPYLTENVSAQAGLTFNLTK
ncbi:MAG: hypothetical protein HYZ14_02155 [Bacteroidetes bacterium]|nr:hypothetical protein [Bacteroidota bacterium]